MNDLDNTRSSDRVLTLEVMDDKLPKSSTGTVDRRLFTGEQQLHIKVDPMFMQWYFQYSQNGLLPDPLKGRFTSFAKAYEHAAGYFAKRNIKISAVRD